MFVGLRPPFDFENLNLTLLIIYPAATLNISLPIARGMS